MAGANVKGEELKKLIKLGKKRTLSFAFCPGAKGDHVILIDRKKMPKVIGQIAKKEGSGSKIAYGTFVVNSKTMELTCQKVVPNMAKVLKKYLKSQKIQVNVLIMDEQGNVLGSDIEDLPDDPSQEDDGEAPDAIDEGKQVEQVATAPDPELAALAGRLKAMQSAIDTASEANATKLNKAKEGAVSQIRAGDLEGAAKTIAAMENALEKQAQAKAEPKSSASDVRVLADSVKAMRETVKGIDGPAGEKLTKALDNAVAHIKAGNLDAARVLLARIETAVQQTVDKKLAAEGTAQSPEAAKWAGVEAKLQPAVDTLIRDKIGDLSAINRFFNFAKEQAAAGNYDKAIAAAGRVAGLIKQARTETTTAATKEAQDAIPSNVVAYTKTRLGWIQTRTGLRKELEGLKSAIDKTTAGIDGLEEVPAKSAVLFDYLEDIDSNLEDTLEQLVETPDGDQREGLKTTARKIIDDYLGVLDTDFFKAVDNNGFVTTSIRATALASLQQISAALAA